MSETSPRRRRSESVSRCARAPRPVRRRRARQPAPAAQRPGGRTRQPGGWNPIHLIVDGIESEVERLRWRHYVPKRHRQRAGGQQILLEDAGNPIELFQPAGA
jgi:hypothetical protein